MQNTNTLSKRGERELRHREPSDKRFIAHTFGVARHRRRIDRPGQALRHHRVPAAIEVRVHHVEPIKPDDECAAARRAVVVLERDLLARGGRRVRNRELRVLLDGQRGIRRRAGGDELRGERERARGEERGLEGGGPGLFLEHRRGEPAGVAGFGG